MVGTLGANLLRNMPTGKGIIKTGYGFKDFQSEHFQFKKRKGTIRAGYGSKGSSIKNL